MTKLAQTKDFNKAVAARKEAEEKVRELAREEIEVWKNPFNIKPKKGG